LPLNRDFIGREYIAPQPYEVSREKIREFAGAIGDENPVYVDPQAANALGYPDVIAPPTFAIIVSVGAGEGLIFDPALGLDYGLVVHGEQKFIHHRPIRPGDSLSAATRVDDIRDAGRNELMTIVTELTADGEQVCTAINTIVSRGTAGGT
jgi:acyl dehydratase